MRSQTSDIRHQRSKAQEGFTLIEILVVTVILGLLLTVAANVFISILGSQNKTSLLAEIRQNASLVIDTFERDVRSAQRAALGCASPCESNTLTLTYPDSTTITWRCYIGDPLPVPVSNGRFTRQVQGASEVNVTNIDIDNGTSVGCTGGGGAFEGDDANVTIVRLHFLLKQGENSPNKVQFSNTDVEFRTTVGPRGTAR